MEEPKKQTYYTKVFGKGTDKRTVYFKQLEGLEGVVNYPVLVAVNGVPEDLETSEAVDLGSKEGKAVLEESGLKFKTNLLLGRSGYRNPADDKNLHTSANKRKIEEVVNGIIPTGERVNDSSERDKILLPKKNYAKIIVDGIGVVVVKRNKATKEEGNYIADKETITSQYRGGSVAGFDVVAPNSCFEKKKEGDQTVIRMKASAQKEIEEALQNEGLIGKPSFGTKIKNWLGKHKKGTIIAGAIVVLAVTTVVTGACTRWFGLARGEDQPEKSSVAYVQRVFDQTAISENDSVLPDSADPGYIYIGEGYTPYNETKFVEETISSEYREVNEAQKIEGMKFAGEENVEAFDVTYNGDKKSLVLIGTKEDGSQVVVEEYEAQEVPVNGEAKTFYVSMHNDDEDENGMMHGTLSVLSINEDGTISRDNGMEYTVPGEVELSDITTDYLRQAVAGQRGTRIDGARTKIVGKKGINPFIDVNNLPEVKVPAVDADTSK